MASRTCWWISSPSEIRSGSCAAAGFLIRLSMARSSGGRLPGRPASRALHQPEECATSLFPHDGGRHHVAATRVCEAAHQSTLDGVETEGHDDRDRGRNLLRRQTCPGRDRRNQLDLDLNQFGRQYREAVEVHLGPTELDEEILTLYVSEITKTLAETGERAALSRVRDIALRQISDPRNLPGLLRLDNMRRREHESAGDR